MLKIWRLFNDHQMLHSKFLMHFRENPSAIRKDDGIRTKFTAAYELIKTCRQHEVLIDQLRDLDQVCRSKFAQPSAVKMRRKNITSLDNRFSRI